MLHNEIWAESDSRNFLCTQGTASTFTREHIMSSSAHRSLDFLTSCCAQTHFCPHLTLSCILLSASWKATQLFAKHRDNKGLLCFFSLASSLSYTHTVSSYLTRILSLLVGFFQYYTLRQKTLHIHTLSLSNPGTVETPALFCSVSVLKVNWPTGEMACSNLDNADLLRDRSELRELPYIYTHTHNIHIHTRHVRRQSQRHTLYEAEYWTCST